MPQDDESAVLLTRFRAGDEQAAQQLFEAYVSRLLRLARSYISPKLAKRVDAEDVVQSAYRSFFVGAKDGRFTLQRSGDLWRLLATITINKVHRQVERHVKAKFRSVEAEEEVASNSGILNPQALARDPSPEEVLAAAEELQEVMGDFAAPQCKMVELRLQGYSLDEIAQHFDCSQRTVRRVIEKLRERLKRRAAASAAC